MLEQVALGQSRFMTPGVAPDGRGILLGRFGLLQFASLDGIVAWLRLYSAENSIDELLPSLQILRGQTPLKGLDLLLRIPATSSYVMDAAARCAKLAGGLTFTGTTKHFVAYRDDRSPYGYDAVEIQSLPQGVDWMLHGRDFSQSYKKTGEISFESLLFRLSLRQKPTNLDDEDVRQELIIVAERGLGRGLMRYFWRNEVEATVGLVQPRDKSAFDEPGRSREYYLFRVHHLPARMAELFQSTPGIHLFRPQGQNVGIKVGYSHVLDLTSCSTAFDSQLFYLFWEGDRVDVLPGPLELSNIEHLTHLELEIENPDKRSSQVIDGADPISVSIRLAPSTKPPAYVAGALIPSHQADWIKRLVYLLPPSTLQNHRIAVTDRGILLTATKEIDILPLGELLVELAPGLLIPAGMELVPRVTPQVLANTLGHNSGVLTVFPKSGAPFQISDSSLVPLERRAVAKIDVETLDAIDMSYGKMATPSIVNDDVGRFPLWGFRAPQKS